MEFIKSIKKDYLATNIFFNICVGVVLFPLLEWSYSSYPTRFLETYLFLCQVIYAVLQVVRIILAVIIGLYTQKQLYKNYHTKSECKFAKGNLWGLIFLFIIWVLYATNWKLHAYLTDYPLQVGLENTFPYGELPLFRKWIYETFISPWSWFAYLATDASRLFFGKYCRK